MTQLDEEEYLHWLITNEIWTSICPECGSPLSATGHCSHKNYPHKQLDRQHDNMP